METAQNQPRKKPDQLAKDYQVARAFFRTSLLGCVETAKTMLALKSGEKLHELTEAYWVGFKACALNLLKEYNLELEA